MSPVSRLISLQLDPVKAAFLFLGYPLYILPQTKEISTQQQQYVILKIGLGWFRANKVFPD